MYSLTLVNLLLTFGTIVTFHHVFVKYPHLINILKSFFLFLSDNNPTIIDFNGSESELELDSELDSDSSTETTDIVYKPEPLFDNKYLDKFKKFPNEYVFSDEEKELELVEFEKIKTENDIDIRNKTNEIQERLSKIVEICEKGVENDELNEFGRSSIVGLYYLEDDYEDDLEDDYEDDPESIHFDELYLELLEEKIKLESDLTEVLKSRLSDAVIQEKAHQNMVNSKLDKLINSYVLESTPLGNIYMRYNNTKGSFEYFSNNSIPYRFLEPVGRKYVITFWCKPLFVDLEEELQKAEIKYDEDKKKREEQKLVAPSKTKDVLVKLKSYNKESLGPSKNRGPDVPLPAHIMANLPNVKTSGEKQLLKENANRYTWEGRLSNFNPLKKIDKKTVNKQLNLTFADFKRMKLNESK
jgi:hypothetical protein